jgi:diamine N-acetyltransferase
VAEDRGPEQPVVNVVGERVALGPLRRDLLPTYQRWGNDFAAADRFGATAMPTTLEQAAAWYHREAAATDRLAFTIYERPAWRALGTCDLNALDHRQGTAYLAIRIGEPDARGQGFGTEAVRLLLDVAFTALGLHNVMLTVAEFNRVGRRAYEKARFRECGRRREAVVLGGRRWDEIAMDCLATEFASPALGRVFVPDAPRP